MSASDVMMAYSRYCRDLMAAEVVSLVKKGVPADAIGFDSARKGFRLRAIKLRWEAPGLFQIHNINDSEATDSCIAIVCRDEYGEVADIAAWAPKEDRVGLWLGNVSMIGEEICASPRLDGDKLWVHEGVLDWLVHRRTGVVILSHDRARPILAACSPIAVKTISMKTKLEAMWRAPRVQVFDDGVGTSTMEAVA